jgi:hypothetical protein
MADESYLHFGRDHTLFNLKYEREREGQRETIKKNKMM